MTIASWQWILLLGLMAAMWFISPKVQKATDFFRGSKNNKHPGFWMLSSSLVISWIFAKSIVNAADLGHRFGFVGSLAYAAYYCSFFVAAWIILALRTKGHFRSIHEFLEERYGVLAVFIFSLLIGFRLLNEIWSNSMVIGSYFGEPGSSTYYTAIGVFTMLTLAYTMKGGMRSSLITDMVQMLLFGFLLSFILSFILPQTQGGVSALIKTGEWQWGQGLNLLLVALIQCFSYPFHDPVMTDRGFIAEPKLTFRAYLMAGVVGILCIVLFSFVGIFGQIKGYGSPVINRVSEQLGLLMTLAVNLIMLTSAASTIDSTFSSATKLIHLDLLKSKNLSLKWGRLSMSIFALVGTLPVFLNPEILSATTISGTMVLGLAPIFLFWRFSAPRASFILAILAGLLAGFWLVFFPVPKFLCFTSGKYAELLAMNVWASLLAFAGFLIPYVYRKSRQ